MAGEETAAMNKVCGVAVCESSFVLCHLHHRRSTLPIVWPFGLESLDQKLLAANGVYNLENMLSLEFSLHSKLDNSV